MIEQKTIARALVALVCLAAVFGAGLFVGRTGGPGEFAVRTQYAIGAMEEAELAEIADQVKVREAREQETAQAQEGTEPGPEPASDARININTADALTLQSLPGIGPAIAERIITHRETHGAFRIIEEITDVSGIGETRFAEIRDQITVE